MKTKLTQTTEKAAKKLQRSSRWYSRLVGGPQGWSPLVVPKGGPQGWSQGWSPIVVPKAGPQGWSPKGWPPRIPEKAVNHTGILIAAQALALLGLGFRAQRAHGPQGWSPKVVPVVLPKGGKAAKRFQRSSTGSLPSRPAPPPTFLRGGDESWPRLENTTARHGRLAPRQHR
jgi:hypothetical protein